MCRLGADLKGPGDLQGIWTFNGIWTEAPKSLFERKMQKTKLFRRLSYFSKVIYGTKFISDF